RIKEMCAYAQPTDAAFRIAGPSVLDHFLDRLDEVRTLGRGRQFVGFLVRLLALAVVEQRHPLHRLIEDAPKGLQPNLFGRFGTPFSLPRRLLLPPPPFLDFLFSLPLALSRFGFITQFFAVQDFTSHFRFPKTWQAR